MQALNELFHAVETQWTAENPLGINDTILAMKSYMKYHHLYAISVFFNTVNNMPDAVPDPAKALNALKKNHLLDQVLSMSAVSLNMAFGSAMEEAQSAGKVFSPQNWSKAKASLSAIRFSVHSQINSLGFLPGGAALKKQLTAGLKLDNSDFEVRWTAD
jgi:hypothetical protein